jgi:cation-dependent mannose-6-phosphate receptor
MNPTSTGAVKTFTDYRTDWLINGRDYGHNFTLNICEPVLSDYSDVVEVSDRTNVSGYYMDSTGKKISIGYGSAWQGGL